MGVEAQTVYSYLEQVMPQEFDVEIALATGQNILTDLDKSATGLSSRFIQTARLEQNFNKIDRAD